MVPDERSIRAVYFVAVKYFQFSSSAPLKKGMLSPSTAVRQLWTEESQRRKMSQSSPGVCFHFIVSRSCFSVDLVSQLLLCGVLLFGH